MYSLVTAVYMYSLFITGVCSSLSQVQFLPALDWVDLRDNQIVGMQALQASVEVTVGESAQCTANLRAGVGLMEWEMSPSADVRDGGLMIPRVLLSGNPVCNSSGGDGAAPHGDNVSFDGQRWNVTCVGGLEE